MVQALGANANPGLTLAQNQDRHLHSRLRGAASVSASATSKPATGAVTSSPLAIGPAEQTAAAAAAAASATQSPRIGSRSTGTTSRRQRTRRGGGGSSGNTAGGGGNSATQNFFEERDPDYDRSLPMNALASDDAPPTDALSSSQLMMNPLLSSITTVGSAASPHGLFPVSEYYGGAPLVPPAKQLYDPRTDPIPSYTKPVGTPTASQSPVRAQTTGGDDVGQKSSAAPRRSRNRDRDHRNRRMRGDDANAAGSSNNNNGHASSNVATATAATDDNHKSLATNRRRYGGRLYNPDSEIDDDEYLKDTTTKNESNVHRSSRRKDRDRHDRQRGTYRDGNTAHGDAQTRESGKIMLLKNPKSDSFYNSTPSRIVGQLDYPRESPEEIEARVAIIYNRILYLEHECAEIDGKQAEYSVKVEREFNAALWWDIMRLHEDLLEQYDDFLFACCAAYATPSIQNLPKKYKIPSRLWKYGVTRPVDLLHEFLPASLDSLRTFIYYAYAIVTRLFECTPGAASDKAIWLESLGDLSVYVMAIEPDDANARIWQDNAYMWYTRCSYVLPGVGRLYHDLAVTSKPNLLDQLFYYCKSLIAWTPFAHARKSILSIFGAALNSFPKDSNKVHLAFARVHGILFTRVELENLGRSCNDFLRLVNRPFAWQVDGVEYAAINIAALFQFGDKDNILSRLIGFSHKSEEEKFDVGQQQPGGKQDVLSSIADIRGSLPESFGTDSSTGSESGTLQNSDSIHPLSATSSTMSTYAPMTPGPLEHFLATDKYVAGSVALSQAKRVAFSTLKLAVTVATAEHYSHIFTWLLFLEYIKDYPEAVNELFYVHNPRQAGEDRFPWKDLLQFLTTLTYLADTDSIYQALTIPDHASFIEDWVLHGFEWTQSFSQMLKAAHLMDESASPTEPSSSASVVAPQEESAPLTPVAYTDVDFDYDRVLTLHTVPEVYGHPEFNALNSGRLERILWVAFKLAKDGRFFEYNQSTKQFFMSHSAQERLDETNLYSNISRTAPIGNTPGG
ncbi:uncharacterized protein V1518DRAFT_213859 [Limtongia smithiae]|uniref:uncharacterized protein n=1 Tax=Limtongia smithiae TaxID=1125753 RepID=UPI0034CDDE77